MEIKNIEVFAKEAKNFAEPSLTIPRWNTEQDKIKFHEEIVSYIHDVPCFSVTDIENLKYRIRRDLDRINARIEDERLSSIRYSSLCMHRIRLMNDFTNCIRQELTCI